MHIYWFGTVDNFRQCNFAITRVYITWKYNYQVMLGHSDQGCNICECTRTAGCASISSSWQVSGSCVPMSRFKGSTNTAWICLQMFHLSLLSGQEHVAVWAQTLHVTQASSHASRNALLLCVTAGCDSDWTAHWPVWCCGFRHIEFQAGRCALLTSLVNSLSAFLTSLMSRSNILFLVSLSRTAMRLSTTLFWWPWR